MTDRPLNNHNSLFLYFEKNKNKTSSQGRKTREFQTEQHPICLPSIHPSIFWLLSKLDLMIVKMMMKMVRADFEQNKTEDVRE